MMIDVQLELKKYGWIPFRQWVRELAKADVALEEMHDIEPENVLSSRARDLVNAQELPR